MTQLIAMLSSGKGTWSQIFRIIAAEKWDRVFLITNKFGMERFTRRDNIELLSFDLSKDTDTLRDEIYQKLKERVSGIEVALNICSGSGKEHMALVSAVLKLGVGVRIVDMCNGRLSEL